MECKRVGLVSQKIQSKSNNILQYDPKIVGFLLDIVYGFIRKDIAEWDTKFYISVKQKLNNSITMLQQVFSIHTQVLVI